jgi:hypothetical protein
MRSSRSYSLALAATGLAVMLTIVGFALYLVPMSTMISVGSGDLTRIGWFSNNRYGNRKPNLAFRPPLSTLAGTLDRHFDVVIVGDSFSLDHDKSWPNYLAAKGLSVLVIGLADHPEKPNVTADIENQITALLQSPTFRDTPPSVFIFESIERFLKRRLVSDAKPCLEIEHKEESNASAPPLGKELAAPPTLRYADPPGYRIEEVGMPLSRRYDEQQLTYARDFLLKNIRHSLGRESAVREFPLSTPRFSSDRANALLVVSEDLQKNHWGPKDIEEMQCQLLRLQRAVQANGKTLFIALPIPDKLSAYHDDLVDPSLPRGVIGQLTNPLLNRPQVDKALRAEIVTGEKDVYLPNDTHFGARGQALTADTVMRFIEERTRKIEASGMPATTSAQGNN